jgi:cyclopropane fatty-acyl-phospholipid synthase-like methyltransferase
MMPAGSSARSSSSDNNQRAEFPAEHRAVVNLWSRAEHARDYFERRHTIPHRDEGYSVLLELVPATVRRVLDLGTGDGYLVDLIRQAHPSVAAMAVDFSAEMLGRAREHFAAVTDVEIVDHDLDDPLPAEWGSFDAVVSAFAIHHVVDARKRALFRDVFDRLEPGSLFLNLEHVDSPTTELHEAWLRAIGSTPEQDDPSNKLVAVETQLEWLRKIGFEHVDCHWKWRELALLAGVKPAR